MNIKFVDLAKQYQAIKQEVDAAMGAALERTDFILGADVAKFEAEFAEYCEASYAVGLDNGTSALEMAMRALEIGPGDEVLVPVNSFIASASGVSFTGATPVFVDVDPATYNIDAGQLERHITPRTKAIVPVHLYGQPADMDGVMAVANKHGLYVVEDACQAHGARYKGRRVGAIGHIGAFSFYPGKNLGAYGDGGGIVTNDKVIADRIITMRNCGQREKYHHVTLSWNRRLDTIQAAVLRVKLRYLDEWNGLRRRWAALYTELLAELDLELPAVSPDVESVFHLYVVRTAERDRVQKALGAEGIASGIHYPIPIHLQDAYAGLGYKAGDFPVAEALAPTLLSLPMFAELTTEEVAYVVGRMHAHVQPRQMLEVGERALAFGAA
jgi:dTDP-4-amino-4,6-dideoxygalactose transaminase